MRTSLLMLLVLALLAPGTADAQAPTGAIAGVIKDASGAAIPAISIVVTNQDTGLARPVMAAPSGNYNAPALPVGVYDVTAKALGYQPWEKKDVTVEAGTTTTINMTMQVGITQTVIVSAAEAPQIRYEAFALGSVITRSQIEGLPANGRSFLNSSSLEPGAQQPVRTTNNRTLVPLLGAPAGQNGRATRVTVDGGSIMQIGNGGSAMGFSQEVTQEFQISTVNLDLSTGITASGAVNVVTRSGTNKWGGSGFLFFRDHTLSAYPALDRDPLNPDPFFQRSQFGVTAGGPIHKDRAFFFGTWERSEQRDVVTTQLPKDFAPLNGIFPSPSDINQFSGRVDVRLTDRHWAFLRHSQEGISLFGTTALAGGSARALPSAWRLQPGQTSQTILGLTSQLWTNLVNDLRLSFFFVNSAEESPTSAVCAGCFGLGEPSITVTPSLFIGSSNTSSVRGSRYHLNDVAAWQKGAHHIRFGGDLEVSKGGRTDLGSEEVTMNLFSPEEVRKFNESVPAPRRIPLPASFLTVKDILQLPVKTFSVGMGDPRVPQKGFGLERVAPVVHLFYQDAWRLHSRLTVNYGLGWTYDAPFNYDLTKPVFLRLALGVGGLGPTRKNWNNFSPSVGFAWSLREDGKTVVRGGAGKYYDFLVPFTTADPERVALGPRGVGRVSYPNSAIENPLTDIPGVPSGTLLTLRGNPTFFTGDALMRAMPEIRNNLIQLRGDDPNNRDFSVTNIEVDKTGSVVAFNLPSVSAIHASLGVQRRIAAGLVVSADLVFRQFSHLGMQLDLNHFAKPGGQVLRSCTPAERKDPTALCSAGAINVFSAIGRAKYQGLLMRVDKRLSSRWEFLGSYAYSTNVGTSAGSGFNNDDPLANYGPLDRDVRHVLNLSGLVELPWQFRLGVVVTYNSRPPFSAFFSALDLNGDGKRGDLLPGTKVNQFNRGLGKEDLRRLVNEFNGKYVGERDALGTLISEIVLPNDFEFSSRFLTADLRLSWMLSLHERWRLTLIGEVFNVFNTENLTAPSGDLSSPTTFGRRTLVTQVFGSGGPRSAQLAFRLSY